MLKDHLSSTRVLIDESGTVAAYNDYSPFGSIMRFNENTEIAYRFTGQEYDSESGLHNYRARLYDSDLGQFYAMDPAAQTPSPFLYAGNNPVIYVDENGKWFGIDDLIISGVSFMVGYVSHGIQTGNWGKDAFASGAIAAGSAWLAYNTGGAAAGPLFSEGSAGFAITSSAVGGAVGAFTSSVGYQAYYNNGNIDLGLAWNATIEGFGGGLVSGMAETSIISRLGKFPGHHLTKHAFRSTSYEIGSNLFAGRPVFKNLSFGANASAIFPAAGDVVYTTSPLWKNYVLRKILPKQIDPKNISHLDIEFGISKAENSGTVISFFSAEVNDYTIPSKSIDFKLLGQTLRFTTPQIVFPQKVFFFYGLGWEVTTQQRIFNNYFLNYLYFWNSVR